jgi:GNAT superfamily N-acetyltransferase
VIEEVQLNFERRPVGRRPSIDVDVVRIGRDAWPVFRPFHYMSADLVQTAACFGAFAGDQICAFCAVIHFPHPNPAACGYRIHRLVTLPDWQGVGIGMVLLDAVASAYSGMGHHVRMPAAHPSLIRTLDRSRNWGLVKQPGTFTQRNRNRRVDVARMGGRGCAVFQWCGKSLDAVSARSLIASSSSLDGSTKPSAPRQGRGAAKRTGSAK